MTEQRLAEIRQATAANRPMYSATMLCEVLAALDEARTALAAAERRLAAVEPVIDAALHFYEAIEAAPFDLTNMCIDIPGDAYDGICEAVEKLRAAPKTDGAAVTAGGEGTLCER